MVHGIIRGLQYEVYLNKPLDLYDYVLPLCIKTRRMIRYDECNNKLVLISHKELNKRFHENVKKHRMDDVQPDWDVHIYSQIKYKSVEPMDDDSYNELVMEINECDYGFYELKQLEKIQSLVRNKDYFEQIKLVEQLLTDVVLNENERKCVERILSDDKIENLIISSGVNFIIEKDI